jgi:hypothetical protein
VATVATVEARTESLGGRGPISIPVGAAWSAGTSAAVAHTRAEPPSTHAEPPSPALRRIVGPEPAAPGALSERTAPPKHTAPAPAAPEASSPLSVPAPTAPLMMLIVAGLLIAASGAVLSRRSA